VTERGTAAIELALGVLVLLVPMAMLVLSFGPSLEARVLARSLAPEVAGILVLHGGVVPAEHVDRLMERVDAAGFDPATIRVDVCEQGHRPLSDMPQCSLTRGGTVEVSVVVGVHRPVVGGPSSVSATTRMRVPDYRSAP
jgi:hypothetical protein